MTERLSLFRIPGNLYRLCELSREFIADFQELWDPVEDISMPILNPDDQLQFAYKTLANVKGVPAMKL